MKTLGIILISLAMLGFNLPAVAAETQSSRSAGKLKLDQNIDLSQLLQQREVLSKPNPTQSENYAASTAAQNFDGIANRHDQIFEIYDADVAMVSDLDGDGYHHAINVYFDVDVSNDSATVYAKLYLSREGGPWSQYYTTDLFSIHIDDTGDAYEVETELLEGYEPGYYAVLVEIYSLDHAYMVTSEVLDYHYLGRDILIEDRAWDEPYHDHGHISAHAGSMGLLLMFFLIIQVVIAARGALALSPCNKSDKNNNNRLL
ncbi:MAG: hypothetical protein GY896_06700 [Gammaproteobacteria bacterium]|nr:hypothetical protein [Gammaproteobacteria bacterium]